MTKSLQGREKLTNSPTYKQPNLQIAQPEVGAEAGKEEDRDCRDSPEGGKRREGRGLQGLKPQ